MRERAQARREVRTHLAGVNVDDLAAGTLVLAGRGESLSAIRTCARRVAARLGGRATELEKAVVDAGLMFAPGPLHGVRIALKKFRYALEVAERLGRFRLTGSMQRLKRLQNLLGEVHDLQVLGGMARDVMAQAHGSRRSALESLVGGIDHEIRALHSRFLAEREGIVALLARSTGVRRTLVSLPPPSQLAPRLSPLRTRASCPTLEDR
jgi:hypothetical protein